MSHRFFCPYLDAEVELSDEREHHIATTHPGTLPEYLEELAQTLAQPDQIRRSERDEAALLFSKWFDSIRTGRYFVVVTVSDAPTPRYWIVTAYITVFRLARYAHALSTRGLSPLPVLH